MWQGLQRYRSPGRQKFGATFLQADQPQAIADRPSPLLRRRPKHLLRAASNIEQLAAGSVLATHLRDVIHADFAEINCIPCASNAWRRNFLTWLGHWVSFYLLELALG